MQNGRWRVGSEDEITIVDEIDKAMIFDFSGKSRFKSLFEGLNWFGFCWNFLAKSAVIENQFFFSRLVWLDSQICFSKLNHHLANIRIVQQFLGSDCGRNGVVIAAFYFFAQGNKRRILAKLGYSSAIMRKLNEQSQDMKANHSQFWTKTAGECRARGPESENNSWAFWTQFSQFLSWKIMSKQSQSAQMSCILIL